MRLTSPDPFFPRARWLSMAGNAITETDVRGNLCAMTTWYADADHDGYGDYAHALSACVQPAGYVANGTDCDDTTPARFPGNPEICDAIDNNCDGQIDNFSSTITNPVLTTYFQTGVTGNFVEWAPVTTGFHYDLVSGNLQLLHSTGGDFTASTDVCLMNDFVPPFRDSRTPSRPGEGYWYVARSVCGALVGTWNSVGHFQVGDRDPEINASPGRCP